MPSFRSARCLPLVTCCALLLSLVVFTACAFARSEYGELSRFGFAKGGIETRGPHAFGVDTTESNSIYVASDTNPEAEPDYQVQKFNEAGTLLGTALITLPEAEYPILGAGIEGVAIDGKEKRLYVLVVYPRKESSTIDSSKTAAGSLYAFSTEPVAKKLVPAKGITNSEGLVASTVTLKAQSETHTGTSSDPLLEPGGIAVDPTTHEVIIAGEEDVSGKAELHPALQRVAVHEASGNPGGELGARYVDPERGAKANSPIVSQSGKVYFQSPETTLGGILEAPAGFASGPPTTLYSAPLAGLVEFDPGSPPSPSEGDGLSLVPSVEGGALYSTADIVEQLEEEEPEELDGQGVLALEYEDSGQGKASEIGWIGGKSEASADRTCVIGEGAEDYPHVAGASEEKIFVLQTTVEKSKEKLEVVKLGPGGHGCPKPSANVLEEVGEELVSESERVAAGSEITLRSEVQKGDALEVEWEFDDGSAPVVVETDEEQEPEVKHVFEGGGPGGLEPTVTERIRTGNLAPASPLIEVARKVKLSEVTPVITKQPKSISVALGANAAFTAAASGGGLSVQWQRSTNHGSSWENDTTDKDVTTQTLTVEHVTAAENQDEYRAVFKNHEGEAKTGGATLTVEGVSSPPVITTNPTSIKVTEGETAKFVAAATGAASVQWQRLLVGSGSWENDTANGGVTTDTLAVEHTTGSESGDRYRAVFKNAAGEEATTSEATLTVETLAEKKLKEEEQKHKEEEAQKQKEAEAQKQKEAEAQKQKEEEAQKQKEAEAQKQKEAEEHKPKGGVAGFTVAKLASVSVSVGRSGALVVKVQCPAGQTSCTGTLTLRTLGAVVASLRGHQAKSKAKVLTLAAGSFTVAGGQTKAVTLHLSAAGRALLARSHVLRARATILAHDPAGGTHSAVVVVTLRQAKSGHH